MPIYHTLGSIPRKRHTAFRKPDGSLYPEQLMGNKGFSGQSSLLYHLRLPTRVVRQEVLGPVRPTAADRGPLRLRHFRSSELDRGGSWVTDRVPLLFNDDLTIAAAFCDADDSFFYRNGHADELVYFAEGGGTLESLFGTMALRKGDYLVIPRGILCRLRLDAPGARLLIVESRGDLRTPKRYRNEFGQLLEHSPFCERDIRRPEALPVHDEEGEFVTVVRAGGKLHEVVLDHHPFDVVGWDGYYYPWALSIDDFEPIVGRIHQPPPVHQTFEGDNFVVCSFVPRLFDFHPEAVPAPYNHSNVMTDEVLYYASDEFMSRKGIAFGSITLHPDGLPHGPHPGRAEASIGKDRTDEVAVMIDTFRPLHATPQALGIEDLDYFASWRT